jgi:LPXTG-motif cell wall-anchored protein
VLAVLALAGAMLVLAAPAAQAAPTTEPAAAAAGWLARQLTDGSHFEQDFGDAGVFPDQGLTLDAVLAFAAAGASGENATAAMTWLGTGTLLLDYVGDGTSFSDAGRLAKVAYAALVTGGDPHDVAGVDVLGRLTSQLTPSGRFSDTPASSDLSNAFGQAFAQLALARTPDGVPPSAVSFLAGSQCPGGGFPLDYRPPTCTPDTDATAMVVQALELPGGDATAAARGVDWLVSQQAADGSFTGTGSTATPNANSTGLVTQALRTAGRAAQADAAVRWLLSLQSTCTAAPELQGAIAYDGNGFDPGNGIRATTQAILGLSRVGLAELSLSGAEPDAPTLDCAGSPTGSPTGSATGSPTGSPTGSATGSPTAAPTGSHPAPPSSAPAPSTVVPTSTPAAVQPITPPITPPPTQPAAAPGSLPDTGADVLPVVWTGVGLVLAGALTAVAGRRRRQTR